MRKRTLTKLLSLAVLAPVVAGWSIHDAPLKLHPQSRLWIEGTSTVRSFECKATTLEATIETAVPDAALQVLGGNKAISSVAVTVPAKKLDCGNGTMNDHMFKAIKADAAPNITFRLSSYDLAKAGEAVTVKMSGRLSIGGTEKPVALEAQAEPGAEGSLRVKGSKEVRLSEFGLKAPSLMMGTMKVGDAVQVRYDLVLRP